VRANKKLAKLPIGRAAQLAFEIDAARADCCTAASQILGRKNFDEREFEDCVKLDEALDQAHRGLKAAIRKLMLERLSRRSRAR
jgi:hypothetical protein